ncbi:methyltransferase domain-containing protein [Patescibacteria group bacterium]|nr:methyltransferase domain-containing protein [Patescibacteria group bacterium]
MHSKYIDILQCPKTHQNLILTSGEVDANGFIDQGTLSTENGLISYQIKNGLPVFVPEESYASSFGTEWKTWPKVQFESENVGKPMEGFTKKMLEDITQYPANLGEKTIAEFGCGSGRFIDVLRKRNATAIGIEITQAAEVANEVFKHDPNVLIVKADLLEPPFKDNSFTDAYTIGVLHHTPTPQQGIKEMKRVVKEAGTVTCRVYSKGGFYGYPSVIIFRFIYRILYKILGGNTANALYFTYAKFSAKYLYTVFNAIRKIPLMGRAIAHVIEKFILVSVNLPDYSWRVLDVFDATTPTHATTHTPAQVKSWFEEAGLLNIVNTKGANTFKAIVK